MERRSYADATLTRSDEDHELVRSEIEFDKAGAGRGGFNAVAPSFP
jgi:hypothetical protein